MTAATTAQIMTVIRSCYSSTSGNQVVKAAVEPPLLIEAENTNLLGRVVVKDQFEPLWKDAVPIEVLERVEKSLIYLYNILGRVSLSRIYKYNILHRVGSFSLKVDGVNDYVNCTNDATLWSQSLTKFSFSLWIYSNNLNIDGTLINHGIPTAQSFGCYWYDNTNSSFRFLLVNAAGGGVSAYAAGGSLYINQWYHVACVYDNSLGTQNLKIYVDGTLGTVTANLTEAINLSSVLDIGSTPFGGNIKDFRWWTTKALTQTEINNIKANSPSAPTPDYWLKMEEGTGNPVDSISGTKTGTLTNGAYWTTLVPATIYDKSFKYLYNILGRVSQSRIYKYDILGRISLSRIYKYNIIARIALSRIYKYNIASRVSLSRIYLYDILARASLSRIYLYNIIGRISLSRIYKYNILERISLSRIYLYNIASRISLSRIYLYNVLGRASLSRIYKYDVLERISLSRIYKYNILERISLSRIYLYNILGRISLSRIYKYNILGRISLSQIYKYNILGRISLSRIYKYNILGRVSLAQIYLYNILAGGLERISAPFIYKYNIIGRVSQSRIYKYNIIGRISLSRIYRYDILQRLGLSRIYRYDILSRASLSQIYRYDIIGRISLSRVYKYNILERISLSRIYKYAILTKVSLSRIYNYNIIGRVSLSRIYKYNILSDIIIPTFFYKGSGSNILWRERMEKELKSRSKVWLTYTDIQKRIEMKMNLIKKKMGY